MGRLEPRKEVGPDPRPGPGRGGRSMRRIARAGFVPEAVLRTNPAVAAVCDEVNAVTSRHAPRRGQGCLLRAMVRQRAAALRHLPAANTIHAHMHIASSCHDALVLSSNTRYAALLPDGDSGAAAAGAGPGVAGSGVASVRFARSG